MDGSGGKFGAVPELRRCAFSVAYMKGVSFQWGVYAPLPGLKQDVPRSELFAFVFLASMLQVDAFAHLVSDSAINVDMFLKGPKGLWRTSENANLWEVLWRVLAPKCVLRVYWVKSHSLDKFDLFQKYAPNVVHAIGNVCADTLAEFGAKVAAPPDEDVARVCSHFGVVRQAQRRLSAILTASIVPRDLPPKCDQNYLEVGPFH